MNPIISLQGKWRYELTNPDDPIELQVGYPLDNEGFLIPGTTASNRVGTPVMIAGGLTKEAVRCLREEFKYLGAAFYQTDFILTEEFRHRKVRLFLERVMFESTVWLDETLIGRRDSLSVPHVFDLTDYVEIGKKHKLTIRIDNRDIQKIGPNPSAYTDETQTIWNGIIGRVQLEGLDEIEIQNVVVGLRSEDRQVVVSFTAQGVPENQETQFSVVLLDREGSVASHSQTIKQIKDGRIELCFAIDETVSFWDEFSPVLYELRIVAAYWSDGSSRSGIWQKNVGLRELSVRDGKLLINGTQRFLRGEIDCCVFPLTGHPPMEREAWMALCGTVKEYGLNHIRFHSWCPPEAAFEVADELGLYLQVEGPVWMDNWTGYTVGCHRSHYGYLPTEAMRIVEQYGYHPSFCIFSNGNELNGDFKLLEQIVRKLREVNPYLLYTLTTNWDRIANPEDDLFIAQSVDGIGVRGQYTLDQLAGGTSLNFENAVGLRDIPVISHEVGQYAVYPNVHEIPKYSGVLKPVNLQHIKTDLDEKGLTSHVPSYIKASGRLAALLYKAELEAALRTENLAGIQLLGLHDFPGQSTAMIGLLDSFYHSKDILAAEEFRTFCNHTVLLANMPKYQYTAGEKFDLELQLAHYGSAELYNVEIEVVLEIQKEHGQELLWKTQVMKERIGVGLSKEVLHINEALFTSLKGRNRVTLTARSKTLDLWNSWELWVYGKTELNEPANCYDTLDEDVIRKLQAGEKVLLLVKPEFVNKTEPGKFFPVFWSPVHFTSKAPCGMSIQSEHPFFKNYFITRDYADLEWKSLLENSFSINIDELGGFEPMTMPVPNFFHNHKYTNLMEAKVLNGSVLVCSIDFNASMDTDPGRRSLLKAICNYFESEDFSPTQTLALDQLQRLFKPKETSVKDRTDIACDKPAFSDSEQAAISNAGKGNDGNPMSMWLAADLEPGHYWTVDLGELVEVTGTRVVFPEKGNIKYVIHTSVDGMRWELSINQTGQTTEDQEREDLFHVAARYVKITYNGLPAGIRAGHISFEVFA